VLDILGAETGQMRLKKSMHHVSQVTSQVIGEFVEHISKKAVKLDVNDKKTKAHFDPVIVAKVFRKILHNAIKFADEGSTITVDINPSASHVDILVTNKGSAIDSKKIEQILKPFTLDEDIMHHSQGMGLGLSVAQSLLKRHHESSLFIKSGVHKTTVGFSLALHD